MTKLKDLPEGTLLISDNDRKGLYSNDNAPIFVMELGDKKASVLWQGTSRYDAFMNPLINKGSLEKNVDYVLPEDVGMLLPTALEMGSFMPSDPDAFCSKVTDETSKGTTDKYYVKMNDLSYLNVDTSGVPDNFWADGIALSGNRIALKASKTDTPWVHTLFTPAEYNSIAEEINQDGSWDEQLPLFYPDNPMFEKAEGTTESSKEKDDSESGTLDEPTFKVHVGNQYNRYLNVQDAGVENIWNDTITLDDGRVVFASDDFPCNNVRITFTLPEYKYIYNKVKSMDTNGEEPSHLPEYDPSDTVNFELVHGEHLPEDKGSEKAPKKVPDKEANKEPKFTVQLTPYGDFLNEELLGNTHLHIKGNTSSYRGTANGDQAYLLNGNVLFLDDESNDEDFKTHFTLEEYNELREQVSLLEGSEDLSWSLPEYNSDNDSFVLAEGRHLPEPVKESNKDVAKLPQWVKDIFDSLVEHTDDSTLFIKEINTLVQFMGEKSWGFYLYRKLNRMQKLLDNYPYDKNEIVAASKLMVKEAKKYY